MVFEEETAREGGRWRIALAFALALAAFLLYLPSLRSDFVYDAEIQIKSDSYIHTPAHLADVATFRVLGQDVLDRTRPVHLFFLMTDSLVWGRNPLGFHLTSNLLHALNAALLFLLLARLGAEAAPGRSQPHVLLAAAVGVAVFIAHPILTEAVAEVSDREDLLALFFTLVALAIATHLHRREPWKTLALGACCMLSLILAAGSKETGFAAPLLLALYGWLFRRFRPRRAWSILVAAAFAAVAAFAAAHLALSPETSRIITSKPRYIGGSFREMLDIQPRIWALLITNTAWPLHLSADYTLRDVAWISGPIAAAILVPFLTAQALLSLGSRLALFGTAMFWLGLAPVSNFIPIFRFMGDRFLYMPMAGVAATCCAALLLVRNRRVYLGLCAAMLAAVVALACLAWQRQPVFANSLSLWRDASAKSPYSGRAWGNLGWALSDAGDYAKALGAFERALQLTGGREPDVWAGVAVTHERMGRPADAQAALEEAVAIDPRFARPQELVDALVESEDVATIIGEILSDSRPSPPSP